MIALSGHLSPYPAQGFGAYSQVGSHQIQRHTVHELGISLNQSGIFFFCSKSQSIFNPSLESYISVLQDDTMVLLIGGNIFQQFFMILSVEDKQFTIFQYLDINRGRIVCEKALQVCDPPSLKRETKNVLVAF